VLERKFDVRPHRGRKEGPIRPRKITIFDHGGLIRVYTQPRVSTKLRDDLHGTKDGVDRGGGDSEIISKGIERHSRGGRGGNSRSALEARERLRRERVTREVGRESRGGREELVF
jgi:hypothetical protein